MCRWKEEANHKSKRSHFATWRLIAPRFPSTLCPVSCEPHANLPATSQRPPGRCRYGLDCARKAAGLPVEASDIEAGRMPWLKQQRLGLEAPAAAAARPEAGPQAVRRPRIFVYDTPPAYTTRMLQYRCGRERVCDSVEGKGVCKWQKTLLWLMAAFAVFAQTVHACMHLMVRPCIGLHPHDALSLHIDIHRVCERACS